MKRFAIIILLLTVFAAGLSAQSQSVKGTVVDENRVPLTGAVVQVAGTNQISVVDMDGTYSLVNVSKGATLVVTCLGYVTQERTVDAEVMDFNMAPEATEIGSVVVTGYQKMDRRMFTGATDRMDADNVMLSGVSDISRSLEGRSAGVSVQNVSGTFGAAPKIRIRGATSIFGSSKPLWVVDGVIMEDVVDIDANSLSSGDATTLIGSAIAGLNSDDIESFQILKDGSATSIYGARAMAGVIVVTTKKGAKGKATVNYSYDGTVRLVPSYGSYNIMNSQEQMAVYEEMYQKGWLNYAGLVYSAEGGVYKKWAQLVNTYDKNSEQFGAINSEEGRRAYLRKAEMRNTDWFKELFRPSLQNNHSVSISSGTDKGSYYASLGAMVDPGWTIQSRVNRYTALFNTSQWLFKDKVNLNIIANASYRDQRAPGSLSSETDPVFGTVTRDFDINPFSYALRTSRTLEPDGFYTRNYAPFNIKDELSKNYMDINVADLKFQAELKYLLNSKVEFTALGAVKYQTSTTEHHITDASNQAKAYRSMDIAIVRDYNPYLYDNPDLPNSDKYSILPVGGIYNRNDFRAMSSDFRATVNYNDSFNSKHILNMFGAFELGSIKRRRTSFEGWGLQYSLGEEPFYIVDLFKKQLEDNVKYYGMNNTQERNVAFVGTASYSYDYRYSINGTIRYEGSNRLGRARQARWLPTWNISGKWGIDQENFFESLKPAISAMSMRLSYSLTADRGPSYVNNSTALIYSTTPWRGASSITESALRLSAIENSELTYEKKHELNAGMDIGFIKDRISLSMDVYTRNNYDLIGNVVTTGLGGMVDKMGNVAEMKSHGVELSLYTRNIETPAFKWQTNFIFAYMDNTITKLETRLRVIDYLTGTGYSMVGYPRGSLFSLQFKGLDEMGIPTFLNKNGKITPTDIQFQETSNFSNLKYEGPVDPPFSGSFGNTFSWNGFKLNVFMTYSFGNVVRLDPVFSRSYSDLTAMPKEFLDRYINPGDEKITDVPVIASKRQNNSINNLYIAYSAYNYSDCRVAKGDFIRLKEVSLSYDIPKKVTSALLISKLSFKLQATNLCLLYADKKLHGQDPEFVNAGGVATPMPKQLTLTCKVTF